MWLNVDSSKLVPGQWKGQVNLRTIDTKLLKTSANLEVTFEKKIRIYLSDAEREAVVRAKIAKRKTAARGATEAVAEL